MNINNAINIYLSIIKKAVEVEDWVDPRIKTELEKIPKITKDPRLINFRQKADIGENILVLNKEEQNFKDDYLFNLECVGLLIRIAKSMLSFTHIIPPKFMEKYGKSLRSNLDLMYNYIVDFFQKEDKTKDFILNKTEVQRNGTVGEIKLTKLYENSRLLIKKFIDLVSLITNEVQNAKESPTDKELSEMYKIMWGTTLDIEESKKRFDNDFKEISQRFKLIKEFSALNNVKEWQNRATLGLRNEQKPKNYEIVFSSNYKDILGMSSRSEWTSCQTIIKDTNIRIGLAKSVIGSCVSKGIGIIYLTDGSDYEGRGERMYYRSAVWVIKNSKNNEEILLLPHMYPRYDERISNMFKSAMERHLAMKVIVGDNLDSDDFSDFVREVGKEETELPNIPPPYGDIYIKRRYSVESRVSLLKTYIMSDKVKTSLPYASVPIYLGGDEVEKMYNLLSPILKNALVDVIDMIYTNGDFNNILAKTKRDDDSVPNYLLFENTLNIINYEKTHYKRKYMDLVSSNLNNTDATDLIKDTIMIAVRNNPIRSLYSYTIQD